MIDFSRYTIGDVVTVHCCDDCSRAADVVPKTPADSGVASWLCEVCGHFGIGSLTDCKIENWLRLRPLQPNATVTGTQPFPFKETQILRVLPNSVRSSNLVRLGYKGSTLYVEFKNGRFYRYDNVPWPRFTQMLEADSVGRFFCQHIKPLPFVRLEQDPFESETDQ